MLYIAFRNNSNIIREIGIQHINHGLGELRGGIDATFLIGNGHHTPCTELILKLFRGVLL